MTNLTTTFLEDFSQDSHVVGEHFTKLTAVHQLQEVHFFFKEKFLSENEPQKLKNLKKISKKSPASNV